MSAYTGPAGRLHWGIVEVRDIVRGRRSAANDTEPAT